MMKFAVGIQIEKLPPESFLLFGRHHRVAARLIPKFENTNKDLPTRLARFQFPESTTRNIAFP
jgi:hypothetical protein